MLRGHKASEFLNEDLSAWSHRVWRKERSLQKEDATLTDYHISLECEVTPRRREQKLVGERVQK